MKVRKFTTPRLPMLVESKMAMWWHPMPQDPPEGRARMGSLFIGGYKYEGNNWLDDTFYEELGMSLTGTTTQSKFYAIREVNIGVSGGQNYAPMGVYPGQSLTVELKVIATGGDNVVGVIEFSDDSEPDYVAENMNETVTYTNQTAETQFVQVFFHPIIAENAPLANLSVYYNLLDFMPFESHNRSDETIKEGCVTRKTKIGEWAIEEFEHVTLRFVCGHYTGDKAFEHKVHITSDQSKHIVFPEDFSNDELDVVVSATVQAEDGTWSGFDLDWFGRSRDSAVPSLT
jgi:hypothetical protein